MLLMFENGIRGEVPMITKRHSEADNKYMGKFNRSEPSKYIQYLNANKLYGWAMMTNLPFRNFKWMK